jgi:predicted RNA-binding Zn-ribbon protein involved in translation (DUF1610 family)
MVCRIARNVNIDGKLAFRKGDEVTVEAIDPDPQAPGMKYVVSSPAVGKKVKLRGVDLDRQYCEKCGKDLDPTQFECPHCGWVVPGREPEQRQKELAEYRKKIREQQESGGSFPPGFPI